MRNYQCPHYPTCLDIGARGNEDFTCYGCPDESRHDPPPTTEGDLAGTLELMAVLFGRDPDTIRRALHGPRPWTATCGRAVVQKIIA